MTSEPYIDQAALARAMGVSLRTVQTWTSEGLPYESWGLRVRRYHLSVAVEWARGRQPGTVDGRVSGNDRRPQPIRGAVPHA